MRRSPDPGTRLRQVGRQTGDGALRQAADAVNLGREAPLSSGAPNTLVTTPCAASSFVRSSCFKLGRLQGTAGVRSLVGLRFCWEPRGLGACWSAALVRRASH